MKLGCRKVLALEGMVFVCGTRDCGSPGRFRLYRTVGAEASISVSGSVTSTMVLLFFTRSVVTIESNGKSLFVVVIQNAKEKHTAAGIRWWSSTQLLISRS